MNRHSNSVSAISEDGAMDAFNRGVYRDDFKEALGRQKPKSMAELMKLATEWAYGEDALEAKHPPSPQDHRDRRNSGDRRDRDDMRRRRDHD